MSFNVLGRKKSQCSRAIAELKFSLVSQKPEAESPRVPRQARRRDLGMRGLLGPVGGTVTVSCPTLEGRLNVEYGSPPANRS